MDFKIFHNIPAAVLAFLLFATPYTLAEEQSTWDKFVNWFKPSPSLEGEGPLYDELKALEEKIDQAEAKYSRERRPGNKARIKKDLDEMRKQRDELVKKIEADEKVKKSNPKQTSSSATTANSSPTSNASSVVSAQSPTPACKPDTVLVRDTVIVHDTLYVIVADKPKDETPGIDSTNAGAKTADSTTASSN